MKQLQNHKYWSLLIKLCYSTVSLPLLFVTGYICCTLLCCSASFFFLFMTQFAGIFNKNEKVYLSHQNADIYLFLSWLLRAHASYFFQSIKRFFDQKKFISTKKWRYFCKSRLDRAGHFTALSHISAADFTISLSNHISKGKYFLVKSFGIGDKITKVFGKSSFEYWHLFVLSIFRNDLGTTVSCDIAHTMICNTMFQSWDLSRRAVV